MVGDVGELLSRLVEGKGFNHKAHAGQLWNQILSHGAGGANDEDAARGGHDAFLLLRMPDG